MTKNHNYDFEIVLIAAVAQNGVIGRDGDLPWSKPLIGDLKRFTELTKPHPIIMGSNTWESIPKAYRPLPDRLNMVLTSNENYDASGAYVRESLEDALESIDERDPFIGGINYQQVFIIGGARVYAEALPLADRLELTEVKFNIEGDTFFPDYNKDGWKEIARIEKETHDFVTYLRK
ncbi:dihydrofolate reductase [Candidatus Woesearchaeota archaeon]|nr:dihydrofolate reductase [Candidatus Woesearchaeota archaeon]